MKLPAMVNPLTGTKTDLSIGNIIGMIIAGVVGFFVIAQSQNLSRKISGKIGVDMEVDPLTAERPKQVENMKRYVS